MKPKSYDILARAVEEGIAHGIRRAQKYEIIEEIPADKEDVLEESIRTEVMNAICEVFDFAEPSVHQLYAADSSAWAQPAPLCTVDCDRASVAIVDRSQLWGSNRMPRTAVFEILQEFTRPVDAERVARAISDALPDDTMPLKEDIEEAARAAIQSIAAQLATPQRAFVVDRKKEEVRPVPAVDAEDEYGWLIEHGGLYWSGREGCGAWVTHLDALRFARWEDADRMRRAMGLESAKATEHVWCERQLNLEPAPRRAKRKATR